jgi:hypothetical protein
VLQTGSRYAAWHIYNMKVCRVAATCSDNLALLVLSPQQSHGSRKGIDIRETLKPIYLPEFVGYKAIGVRNIF